MFKIGIIGFGNLGHNFFKYICDIKEVKLVGIYDINLNSKHKNIDSVFFNDFSEFLSQDIDLAILAIPCYNNFEYIKMLLRHGINILCSSPMTNDPKEISQIINLVEKSRAKLIPAHVLEYLSSYTSLRDIIKRGKIGKPGFMRISFLGSYPNSYNDWLLDDNKGGSIVLNLGVHQINYITSLFGNIERVFAKRIKFINKNIKKDYALILLRSKNDDIIHLELSWCLPKGHRTISKIDVFGTNGQIQYDDAAYMPITIYSNENPEKYYSFYTENNPQYGSPYKLIIEDSIKYLKGQKNLPVSLDSSFNALKIAMSCIKSYEHNCVEEI